MLRQRNCQFREILGNFWIFLERQPACLITIPGKPGNHPGPGDDIEAGQPEEHLPGPGHLGGHHPLPHRVLHLNLSLQRYPAPTSLVFFSNNQQLLLLSLLSLPVHFKHKLLLLLKIVLHGFRNNAAHYEKCLDLAVTG